ncbi:MAG: glycosyltransferase family 2 protein [Planctomycetota bacterium]
MPAVSVIIPFYNRVTWLSEAVQSVLNQTYHDFEIVIIDDGSDESVDFLNGIRDPRIRYVRQEHKGPAIARNHGIELATGEYLSFLDSDDIFMPNKLEVQIAHMIKHTDVCLSHTSYIRINLHGEYIEEVKSGKFTGKVYPKIIYDCPIATPTVMIRKSLLNELKFEETVNVGEDIILWALIAKRYEILGIAEPLTKVRMHGRNVTDNPETLFIGNMNIYKYVLEADKNLKLNFRIRVKSKIYRSTGILYYEQNQKVKGFRYLIRGFCYWPLGIKNLLIVPFLLIPRRLRTVFLKKIRRRGI